jgi:hypothetical protein
MPSDMEPFIHDFLDYEKLLIFFLTIEGSLEPKVIGQIFY